jgi:hypothetical protein
MDEPFIEVIIEELLARETFTPPGEAQSNKAAEKKVQ